MTRAGVSAARNSTVLAAAIYTRDGIMTSDQPTSVSFSVQDAPFSGAATMHVYIIDAQHNNEPSAKLLQPTLTKKLPASAQGSWSAAWVGVLQPHATLYFEVFPMAPDVSLKTDDQVSCDKKTTGRPHLIRYDNVTDARLENITLLNAANHFTYLGGRGYLIHGLKIRSPPFHVAPNTDGLNLRANDLHVKNCDITNGDDSVVIKSPSTNVLVEDTIVRHQLGPSSFLCICVNSRTLDFRSGFERGIFNGCVGKLKQSEHGLRDLGNFENHFMAAPY